MQDADLSERGALYSGAGSLSPHFTDDRPHGEAKAESAENDRGGFDVRGPRLAFEVVQFLLQSRSRDGVGAQGSKLSAVRMAQPFEPLFQL